MQLVADKKQYSKSEREEKITLEIKKEEERKRENVEK